MPFIDVTSADVKAAPGTPARGNDFTLPFRDDLRDLTSLAEGPHITTATRRDCYLVHMAKSYGQQQSEEDSFPSSAMRGEATRKAILRAASELLAEVGWRGTTTRLIAKRAGVPHGAIGYHFNGKDEILRRAALDATSRALAVPIDAAHVAGSLAELLAQTSEWFSAGGLSQPGVAQLFETAREATRDEELRDPLAELIQEYRDSLTELIERDQRSGRLSPQLDPSSIAGLIAALMDGLLLHLVIDPSLNGRRIARAALEVLGAQE